MNSGCLLALDQGTTRSKAVLFDADGRIIARASRPLVTASPRPGWVEQDPEGIWQSAFATLSEAVAGAKHLAGLGISNQRETVVLWDRKSGEPLHPAIVWQCRRSAAICHDLLERGVEKKLRRKTGLSIDPLFSGGKLAWLLRNIDGLRARAQREEVCCGTVDSWLIWKLSGGQAHVCDVSNAARTQLLNLHTLDWDEELLELFEIPATMLPRIVDSSSILGRTVAHGAIPAGVAIGSAIGDSHAALVGQQIFTPGPVKATYGTGSSLMTLCKRVPDDPFPLSATVAWSRKGQAWYALEGNVTMAGDALEWCSRFLGCAGGAEEFAALADTVGGDGGITFVPAMCGLGAPHWESDARGAVLGLERGSTAAHLAYAVLNAIAFQAADVFQAMQAKTGQAIVELRADGGCAKNDLLMQIQANVLGRQVARARIPELSAVGAGYLAGLSLDLWESPAGMAAMQAGTDCFEPSLENGHAKEGYERWKEAVRETVGRAWSGSRTGQNYANASKN